MSEVAPVITTERVFDEFGSELITRDDWLYRIAVDTQADPSLWWDQQWRLDNLYWIVNKNGQRVVFHMNDAQRDFYNEMNYLNVILKARQRGFTTFIDLYILDTCVWNEDVRAGIIAHHLDDAKVIFRDKVQFPYNELPESIRQAVPAKNDRTGEIVFGNGSSIRVSTSMRSGTLQFLHVSEYGKIAAKFPEKAREIKTGAFEAVGAGQMIVVESTAEGRAGEFYELCKSAQNRKLMGRAPGAMDFKFHFYPWWGQKEYTLDPSLVAIPSEMSDYFEDLETMHNVFLTPGQKAWYARKFEVLRDDMYREHPSYPEEAFKASVEGAYYAKVIAQLRLNRQIGKVPYDPSLPVNTFWDLGVNDTTSIWFHQQMGLEHRLIDYYESSGEGLKHFAKVLQNCPYVYNMHYMPHDANSKSLQTGKTLIQTATDIGIRPTRVVKRAKNEEEVLTGIESTRLLLTRCWIDEEKCDRGLKALENYRKEWDERGACWKKRPFHDWSSNGADALRTGGVGLGSSAGREAQSRDYEPEVVADY